MANDTDAQNDALSAELVNAPADARVVVQADGTFTVETSVGFLGDITFSYRVSDGIDSDIGQATVSFVPSTTTFNTTAEANLDNYVVAEGGLVTTSATGVLANDTDIEGDPLTARLVSGPSNGTVALNADGSFSYVAKAGFAGIDTFIYQADDGQIRRPPNDPRGDITTVVLSVESGAPEP